MIAGGHVSPGLPAWGPRQPEVAPVPSCDTPGVPKWVLGGDNGYQGATWVVGLRG